MSEEELDESLRRFNAEARTKTGEEYSRSSLPRGVLVKIFGGGVPPVSPNPDPISDQKMLFPTPVFRPGLKKSIPVFRPHLVRD